MTTYVVPAGVNVTLDEVHALKLRRLAERTHTNEGTLARSLLSTALNEADADARNVTELLDGIPGALERAGPWRSMVIVYVFDSDTDRVLVVTIQDGRPFQAE
jgi:hypothetical protein